MSDRPRFGALGIGRASNCAQCCRGIGANESRFWDNEADATSRNGKKGWIVCQNCAVNNGLDLSTVSQPVANSNSGGKVSQGAASVDLSKVTAKLEKIEELLHQVLAYSHEQGEEIARLKVLVRNVGGSQPSAAPSGLFDDGDEPPFGRKS